MPKFTSSMESKVRSLQQQRKKDAAYTVLIEIFQEKYQNYTREQAKNKINSYGTNYRKELKKVLDSEKSGAVTDQV